MDLGQSKIFTSTVSGGTSPFYYQWCLNGVAVSGATGSSWTFTPSSTGSYSIYLNATNAVSAVSTSNTAKVTVNPTLSVSISPTSAALNGSQRQTFTSSVSGGTSPYTYQWYENGTAVSGASSPSYIFTPSSSGSFTVLVNVTDNAGANAKSNVATVTVTGLVHAVAITSITPSSFEAYPTWTVPLKINVTIKNLGNFNESFPVALYWNKTNIIGTQNVTLPVGETINLTYTWAIPSIPKAYPYPKYILLANATLPSNINPGNNVLTGGAVKVKWPGDANGDGKVDSLDLSVLAHSWYAKRGAPNYNLQADFNNDGVVNSLDLSVMALSWYRGPVPG